MLIRRTAQPSLWRRIALCVVMLAALAMPVFAQQAAETLEQTLTRIKVALDQVEATLKSDSLGVQTLADLRRAIVAARDELRLRVEELEPRVAEVESRLKQLGAPPASGAPPEDPKVAAERTQLTQSFSELDGALKQARLLALRTEQLSDRISEKRRALYARELLERGASALDPYFWIEAAEAIPGEARSLANVAQSWWAALIEAGPVRVITAAVLILAMLAAGFAATRRWLPRVDAGPGGESRFARARAALWVFIWLALRTPLTLAATLQILEAFGLLPYRVSELTGGLIAAVIVAAFGHGVARGLFAPGHPERRLAKLDDHTAESFYDHLVWATRLVGVTVFLQVTHKTLFSPIIVTVATNALFAIAIAALMLHLVRRLRRAELGKDADAIVANAPGVRLVAWALVFVVSFSLLAGYAALAAFVALRVVVAAAIFAALYLLLVATDALFSEALGPDSPRSRAIAANLGVNVRSLSLVSALLSAGIRVTLIVLALILVIGPWDISTADVAESAQRIPLAFRIGEINISFRAILAALTVLVVTLVITRAVQRWLTRELLPRTSIEPSLQLSVSTIFGYIGVITAIALTMGSLGIDLQKIAFVASALAVGIGFGLQSIVSNFVSGLILLAERPIRIGDSIVVKGEEGWVRRIRVRATEIETYERASVIIPNSELITGMVKNWTHANTMGRIIVKVGVGYDSDPEQVRDLLVAIAQENPLIVQSPPPAAFFTSFGGSSLDFELRCVVGNVANGLGVKSDLHIQILKRFRAAGIEIPFPQQDVRLIPVPNQDDAGAKPQVLPST